MRLVNLNEMNKISGGQVVIDIQEDDAFLNITGDSVFVLQYLDGSKEVLTATGATINGKFSSFGITRDHEGDILIIKPIPNGAQYSNL